MEMASATIWPLPNKNADEATDSFLKRPSAPVDRTLREAKTGGFSRNCWFSPDATIFATADDSKKLVLHDLRSGEAPSDA